LDLLSESGELRERLRENTALFRSKMTSAAFDVLPGEHPITPVMIGDAAQAAALADLAGAALVGRRVLVAGTPPTYEVLP
ncbi:MAG: glycine C-acetyltransferase, partial [Acidimicrobiales bacterium]